MPEAVTTCDLDRFDITPCYGFLSKPQPLTSDDVDVGPAVQRLEVLARAIPDHLADDDLRPRLRNIDPPSEDVYEDLSRPALMRLYQVAGFLAAAHVHKVDAPAVDRLPAGVAVPLFEVAHRLGRTPMLSYDAYVLTNWTTTVSDRDLQPQIIEPSLQFVPAQDEQWFIAIHAAIEAMGGRVVTAIGDAQQGVREDVSDQVHDALGMMTDALYWMRDLLDRMPDHTDSEVFGHGFRPYLEPFSGIIYDGVEALEGPRTYRGASGAQSSLLPALDATLGIDHEENAMVDHLHTHRRYMPPEHRAFIEAAAAGPSVRKHVTADTDLRMAYNECLDELIRFREHHATIVKHFLADKMDVQLGSGGTPYSEFLDSVVADTREARL